MERIDNYLQDLYLAEEFELLGEGIGDTIKNFTSDKAKSLIKKFNEMIKSGNIKGAQRLAKSTGLSKVKPKAIDKLMNTKSADYSIAKGLASRVLKNSLPGNPKKQSIDRAAIYIAVRSLMSDKKGVPLNVTVNVKRHIKDFVTRANKYYDDYEQERETAEKEGEKAPPIPRDSLPDYIVGATIIVGFTSIGVVTTWWLYTNLFNVIILFAVVAGGVAAAGILVKLLPLILGKDAAGGTT